MADYQPTPADKFSFGLWTVGLAGPRPLRRRHPAAHGPRRGRLPPGRAGRLGRHLPRRRPHPLRLGGGRPRGAHPALQGRPREDGHGGTHADHQPLHAPGLQGRRLHRQRSRRAPLRAAQGHAQPGPGGGAGRPDLRLLGRPRGRRGRLRQGPAGRARPLQGSLRPPLPVRHRQGLRPALRPGAQAQRAPRATSSCPPSGMPWPSSSPSSTARWWASTRRSATSRWPA